ncbi:MAG TPA: Stp1/IreP family PP2C-type Ser/Thr phosphatase, partial [Armatimonadetes bacterium]|nr:Stp1/IreP family PP2C-type Ser/Thr phosphatase [Armatimonadota bacterium]
LVADGMGGHEAGEIASRLALECVGSRITRCLNEFLSDARSTELASLDGMALLREAFEHANATVFQQAQAMRNNMGTTLVGVLVIGARAWFANVGDSRAYLLHGGKLEQVTVDHSLVQQLVDSGHITREEARWHPQRNVIYRAIGLQADVDVDIFERVLMPGDCVLLCSDGLSDLIEDDEIERVILSETDLHAACMRLIGLANDRGGNDNITVVLVAVEAGMSD